MFNFKESAKLIALIGVLIVCYAFILFLVYSGAVVSWGSHVAISIIISFFVFITLWIFIVIRIHNK